MYLEYLNKFKPDPSSKLEIKRYSSIDRYFTRAEIWGACPHSKSPHIESPLFESPHIERSHFESPHIYLILCCCSLDSHC